MKKQVIRFCSMLLMLAVLLMASSVLVWADGEKTVSTDKTVYTEGEAILVTAIGDQADWVGIYEADDVIPDDTSIVWYYVAKDGNTSGTAKNIFDAEYVERQDLAALPAGEYIIYLLENDGYNILAQQAITIEVASTQPDPADPPADDEENNDQTGSTDDEENNDQAGSTDDEESNDQTGSTDNEENNDQSGSTDNEENNNQTGSTDTGSEDSSDENDNETTVPETGDMDYSAMLAIVVAMAGAGMLLGRKRLCK